MKLVNKNREFELASEGPHMAVLVDILDLGASTTRYGVKERVRFIWLVEQVGKDGKQLSVIATYTNSLNEKANLVHAIRDITGTIPAEGFETETLIGTNARIVIKHNKAEDGRVFANIVAILRPGKGDSVLRIPAWFVRAGGNNTPPATAATIAPPKAPAPNTPPAAKPVANASSEEQNKGLESPPEPPEPGDWDPSQYDEASSFPSSDAADDQHAA